MTQKIPFYLSADEINVIAAGLSELPYKLAAPVVDSLRVQVAAANAAAEAEAAKPPAVAGAPDDPKERKPRKARGSTPSPAPTEKTSSPGDPGEIPEFFKKAAG